MLADSGPEKGTTVRQRRLNEEEQALWAAFAQGIAPLRTARPAAMPDVPASAPAAAPAGEGRAAMSRAEIEQRLMAGQVHAVHGTAAHRLMVHKSRDGAFEIGVRRPGLDDTSWRGLVSGKLRPARRLDLHGQVAQTAFHRLHGFLVQAHADNVRCVEIITGWAAAIMAASCGVNCRSGWAGVIWGGLSWPWCTPMRPIRARCACCCVGRGGRETVSPAAMWAICWPASGAGS